MAIIERILTDSSVNGTLLRLGLPLLFIFVFVYFTQRFVLQYRKLRHFKGPWLASFSELWLLRAAITGKMHLKTYEQCNKHAEEDLVRVGPNMLVTADPKICYHMSSAKQKHNKGQWYAPLKVDPFVNNIFSERNPERHDVLRRQMIRAFSAKDNPNLEEKINRGIAGLIDLIERKYLSTATDLKPCDFAEKAQFFSMDVITDIALSQPFGDCAADDDIHGYIDVVATQLPLVTFCTSSTTLLNVIDSGPMKKVIGPSEKDKDGQGALIRLARGLVEARTGPNKTTANDMLGYFLRDGMSPRQAQSEILTQLLAGSDTTSTSVRATWLHIISSPVFTHLRTEVDTAIKAGAISSPITDAEARQLPYLQACIREGFRIWPPFTGLLVKHTNPEGEHLNGTYVPGDTQIGHCTWGLMRHKVFGADADMFRPERWLEAEPDQLKEMESVVDLVFGSGRWQCMGKQIVWTELRKVFVELIRRFECSLIYQAQPWDSVNYTLFLQKNMWCRFERRAEPL